MEWKERYTCRACGDKLATILDFGSFYPSAFVTKSEDLTKVPLVLTKCYRCDLVQLKHTVDQDTLYREYWYKSGLNKTMVSALEDIAKNINKRIILEEGDTILDIGANDGTLFSFFPESLTKVEVDPAKNILPTGYDYINDYFTADEYLKRGFPKARVITTIAMFYDLEDPNTFISDLKKVLAPDGIWVIQLTDLISMLKLNAFDNVCHEHLEYYSLKTISKLLAKHNLDIFDVSYNDVNGGSLRVYVCFKQARQIDISVQGALHKEEDYLKQFYNPFYAFKGRVERIKKAVGEFIENEVAEGKTCFLLGASTKGNTLIQYFELDNALIPYALEVNEDKFGKHTIGTNIQIIPEVEGLAKKPDYLLCPVWHFRDFFIKILADYIEDGGAIIFPLPVPEIVSRLGITRLAEVESGH